LSAHDGDVSGPDLSEGVPLESIPEDGMLVGHVGSEPVLLSRSGSQVFAIGGKCTHYGGPLGEGLVVGNSVRCPWHHACFDLHTGEATCAPALNPVPRWEIVREGALVKVGDQMSPADGATPVRDRNDREIQSIVIVGAGAAGNAAAEMLRREGYRGKITMIGRDDSVPYDRPNLSKDYLAGDAPEEWIPLRPPEFYEEHAIELIRATTVSQIDVAPRTVRFGTSAGYRRGPCPASDSWRRSRACSLSENTR
jgi:nitrite reductase/ring-hydroxylating ferredoxin subunit